MPPRRRMAWWYGFAAAYTIAAVVLLILTVWIPAAACAVIGVGLTVSGTRERLARRRASDGGNSQTAHRS